MSDSLVPGFSQEDTERLERSLEKIASQVEGGDTPNDAFVKVCREEEVPPGQIRFLVQVFNTSRAETQRRLSDTREEKAASFDLADAGVIVDRLYPAKMAKAVPPAKVSPQYRTPPPNLVKKRQESMDQAATTQGSFFTAKPVEQVKPATAMPNAYADWLRLQNEIDETRRQARQEEDRAKQAAHALTVLVGSRGVPPWPEVVHSAELGLSDTAVKLAHWVSNHLTPRQRQEEEQRFTLAERRGPQGDLAQPVYAQLEKAASLAVKAAQSMARADQLAAGQISLHDRLEVVLPPLPPDGYDAFGVPFFHKQAAAPSPPPPAPPPDVLDGLFGKEAFMGGALASAAGGVASDSLLRDIMRQGPGMKPTSELGEGVYSQLVDPYHEQKMRDIQAEAVVNNLLANDDVISGHDPNQVLDHYNELVGMAPHMATNLGAVRTLLRKRLHQGASDPYDLQAIMQMDNLSKRQAEPTREGGLFNDSNQSK